MARSVVLLASLAIVVLSGLSGCIQVQVPTSTPVAGAPQAPAATAPADKYPVTCVLLDDKGVAVDGGSCEYRFGTLGGVVEVDENGTATRLVPTGAKGTVKGTAPGHAGAQATLTVNGPKTVRMTLPETKAAPRPAAQPEGAAAGNGSAPQAVADNTTTAPEVYEPKLLVLLDEVYVLAPAEVPESTYRFTVPADVDTLELVGTYEYGPFATLPDVRLYGPDGQEVGRHTQLLYSYYPTPIGGNKEIPMVYVLDPAPGEYRLAAGGTSTTTVRLVATAYTGLAPDFSFTPLDGSSRDLSSFRGTVVLVDLMATWCGPCHDAMPGLKRLSEDYGDQLAILSVDIDAAETEQELAAMKAQYGAEWLWGFEDSGSASDAYGSGYIPTFAIIDARGGLVYRQVGAVDDALARELIDAALERGG